MGILRHGGTEFVATAFKPEGLGRAVQPKLTRDYVGSVLYLLYEFQRSSTFDVVEKEQNTRNPTNKTGNAKCNAHLICMEALYLHRTQQTF